MKRFSTVLVNGMEFSYTPITPKADEALESEGRRIIFQHSIAESRVIVAEPGILTAGWVLGVEAMPLRS